MNFQSEGLQPEMTFSELQVLHGRSGVDPLGQVKAFQHRHHQQEHPEPECQKILYLSFCLRVCEYSCILHSAQLLGNNEGKDMAKRVALL